MYLKHGKHETGRGKRRKTTPENCKRVLYLREGFRRVGTYTGNRFNTDLHADPLQRE